jgi:hypothetical protein
MKHVLKHVLKLHYDHKVVTSTAAVVLLLLRWRPA